MKNHRFATSLLFCGVLAFIACFTPGRAAEATQTEFGGATPLQWSVRLADSEISRIGQGMSASQSKWAYDNFLFFRSLIKLDEQLKQSDRTAWAKVKLDSFISADGAVIKGYKLEEYNIDMVAPGRTVLEFYSQTKDPRYLVTAKVLREQLKTHPRTSEGGFWHKTRYPHQMWLDGLFMGSPFLAEYGRLFNEPANFDEVAKQIRLVGKYTYDEKTGLFYHAWDEKRAQDWANKTTGKSPNFWSRAMGWYAMAMVDTLDSLPADHPGRPEIAAMFNKLAAGLVKHQDPASGAWWQVTDQGARKGNYLEATSSSMFVYSMAKAINQGILSRDYLPTVLKGYDGLIREFIRTDDAGRVRLTRCCQVAGLGYGRDGTFEYYISEPIIDNDTKGTGPFILAGLELERLLGLKSTNPASTISNAPVATSSPATAIGDYTTAPWNQVPIILARIKAPTFPNREFSIVEYGAPTDGKGDSTEAIRKAIEACNAAGGGIVLVPPGTFLTGAVHLKSNVNLHIDGGAKLLFYTDPARYRPAVFSRWEGVECYNYSPLIYAYEQENIAITGGGTIDGQADYDNWWGWVKKSENEKLKNPPARASRDLLFAQGEKGVPVAQRQHGEGFLRPPFIQPYRCKNILIEGVTILRSPFWEINPVLCENVTVRGVTIKSHGPNNDGCDPESCKDVLIENTEFDTGDDCIAIKSGRNNDGRRVGVASENLIIRNSIFKDGHGGVTIGSEISGDCRNVFIENCRMDSVNLDRALRLKTNAVRGGTLEKIYMRNVEVGRVADAVIHIDFNYEEGAKGNFTPIVRDIIVENVTSRSSPRALSLKGFAHSPIRNVRLINCTFSGVEGDDIIQHVEGLEKINVKIEKKQ